MNAVETRRFFEAANRLREHADAHMPRTGTLVSSRGWTAPTAFVYELAERLPYGSPDLVDPGPCEGCGWTTPGRWCCWCYELELAAGRRVVAHSVYGGGR